MSAVNIKLTGELAEFIEDRVASGDYDSAERLVGDAVRLLSAEYDRRLESLKSAIDEGLADVEAGRLSTRTVREIAGGVLRPHGR